MSDDIYDWDEFEFDQKTYEELLDCAQTTLGWAKYHRSVDRIFATIGTALALAFAALAPSDFQTWAWPNVLACVMVGSLAGLCIQVGRFLFAVVQAVFHVLVSFYSGD